MNFVILTAVFAPFVLAIVNYIIGRKNKTARDYFSMAVTVSIFALFLYLFIGTIAGYTDIESGAIYGIDKVCGLGIHFTFDGFRAVYCLVAAFMWMMTALFSKQYFAHYRNRNRYHLFFLFTLGATLGVFLSADFYTTFIFFEIMSFTSYVWVAHEEKKEALRAAATYMAVAVIGGLVMLMGIFLLYDITGGVLYFSELKEIFPMCESASTVKVYSMGACILFGFAAKAGAFPLHIWLPKAHPVAPAPASALLSGILTKAGVFGILILSLKLFFFDEKWGVMILITGVVTMFLGALLALFSVDIKRTLACSSVSQIGFILTGIGTAVLLTEENALAVNGSLMHMINHSLIKLVLFMAAGVIYMNIHSLDLNTIKGFGRNKPLFHFIFLMGALGIGGMPLFNGYISKTLIHEGIVEYFEYLETVRKFSVLSAHSVKIIEWIFLISGGLTVAYMTKLYICVFVEKNNDTALQQKYDSLKSTYMSKLSASALTVSAIVLPVFGLLPDKTLLHFAKMSKEFLSASEMHTITWFSVTNLKGAAISILIGVIVYLVVVRTILMTQNSEGKYEYVNRWNKYIDLENLVYRPLILQFIPFVCALICRIPDSLIDSIVVFLRKTVLTDMKIKTERTEGNIFTELVGTILNKIQDIRNSFDRKHLRFEDYEHIVAGKYEAVHESFKIITRSFSFGLILFCIGLLATVVYLMF